MKISLFFLVAAILLNPQDSEGHDDDDQGESHPHVFAEIDPQMDGMNVTVRFTVAGTEGIAQRHVPGQSPSFCIQTEEKRLTVWVEGELASVFDRLQMGFSQTNQLKKGTAIVATGKLIMEAQRGLDIGVLDKSGKPTVWDRKKGAESYTLHLREWKQFRIVSRTKLKKE